MADKALDPAQIGHINELLDIVLKCVGFPVLSAISGEAMAELVQINTGLVEVQVKRAEEAAKKAAEQAKEKEYA